MKVSTRGRYALRVMIDLAEHSGGEYIAMREIAARQAISLKYLERILPSLVEAGIIEGVQGKGGGYRLLKQPGEISVGQILRLTEGELAPVSCDSCAGQLPCTRTADCRTKPMWDELKRVINDYLDSVTIEALMKQ